MEKNTSNSFDNMKEKIEVPAKAEHEQAEPKSNTQTVIHFSKLRIVLAVLIIIMAAILLYQHHEYHEVVEHQAYVVSTAINVLEDRLLLKYGYLPKDVGLGELREAWINNPCYETSYSYYESLSDVLDYLDEGTVPDCTTKLYTV